MFPMQNKLEYFILLFFVRLTRLLGLKRVKLLARIIGDFFFFFIPIRKNIVINNLTRAFPEENISKIKEIARNNYRSIARTFLEAFLIPVLNEEQILNKVEFSGLKELKNSIKEGKGVILLTAHFGNWELAAVAIAIKLKIRMTVLSKQQRNPFVTEWFDEMRRAHGNDVANLGVGVRKIFTTIRRGGVVGLVADQRGPKEGMRVKLFGRATAIYTGASEMAFKSGAAVFLVFCNRKADGKFFIHIEEFFYKDLINEKNIKEFNQRYITALEKKIREYPEQWFWMHNIWKY